MKYIKGRSNLQGKSVYITDPSCNNQRIYDRIFVGKILKRYFEETFSCTILKTRKIFNGLLNNVMPK